MNCVSREVLQEQVRILSPDNKIGRTGSKNIRETHQYISTSLLPLNTLYPDLAISVLYMYCQAKDAYTKDC